MSSQVMEYASEDNNGSGSGSGSSREDVDERRFELLRAGRDPAASDLHLTPDDFLGAAISVKDQVLITFFSWN